MSKEIYNRCVYGITRPAPENCRKCDDNQSGFVRADRQDYMKAEFESIRAENARLRKVVEAAEIVCALDFNLKSVFANTYRDNMRATIQRKLIVAVKAWKEETGNDTDRAD